MSEYDMKNPQERIETLLQAMTLEEKVSLLAGASLWTTSPVERLGIPAIKVTDGPNGARGGGAFSGGVTAACFPVGISLAATWNTELIEQVGRALGQEAKTKGASLLLAPTVNIHRSPLNGRNFECYSEDPYLSARSAVAYINGLQSEGVGATVKHYVCNDSEFERDSISSEVSERALREIYLPPFEAAVKEARTWAVMSAYNKINGVYASENERTLIEILKKEWEFDGIVMSDWMGTYSTIDAANNGLDLEMPGPPQWRGERLVQAVKDGRVSVEAVDEAARRMLLVIILAGAFENPEIPEERAVDLPEHRVLARKAATEGIVLLKNQDGILPLRPKELKKIAVIGPNAKYAQIMGGGSAQVSAHYAITPWEGIIAKLDGAVEVGYQIGCTNHKILPRLDLQMLTPAEGGGHGLSIEYFNSLDLTGEVVARDVIGSSERAWFGDVAPGVNPGKFSACLSGAFTPDESGRYTLGLSSAGLSRLYIDGELVIDNWSAQQPGEYLFGMGSAEVSTQIEVQAGQPYELRLEFSRKGATMLAGIRLGGLPPVGEDSIKRAAELAKDADVALVFVGLNGEWESEGYDRPDMELVGNQAALIEAVAGANPNTVVVLQSGSPIRMPWLHLPAGVLQAWFPGQECGNAIADVLFDDANPSGKLPQTFPKCLEDNPAYINYPGENGKVRYGEGIFVGYRYYEKKGISPLFPFGYGLSYTTFAYDNLRLGAESFDPEQGLEVMVDVTNTGQRPGQEVVQLYVRDPESSLARPRKELKAFTKVALEPGETQTVTLRLDLRSLAYYDDAKSAWVAEAGDFEVLVGSSSVDIHALANFTLAETVVIGGAKVVEVVRLSIDSKVKELLKNEQSVAVLEKHLPGFSDHPQLGMAMGFTLGQIANFAPDQFPKEKLEAIAVDLEACFPTGGAEPEGAAPSGGVGFDLDTPLQELLDHAGAKAVLDKHFPGMSENPQTQMALGMSLKQVAPFAKDVFTEEKLQAVAADLAALERV